MYVRSACGTNLHSFLYRAYKEILFSKLEIKMWAAALVSTKQLFVCLSVSPWYLCEWRPSGGRPRRCWQSDWRSCARDLPRGRPCCWWSRRDLCKAPDVPGSRWKNLDARRDLGAWSRPGRRKPRGAAWSPGGRVGHWSGMKVWERIRFSIFCLQIYFNTLSEKQPHWLHMFRR